MATADVWVNNSGNHTLQWTCHQPLYIWLCAEIQCWSQMFSQDTLLQLIFISTQSAVCTQLDSVVAMTSLHLYTRVDRQWDNQRSHSLLECFSCGNFLDGVAQCAYSIDEIDLAPPPQPDGNNAEHFQVSDVSNHEVFSVHEDVFNPRPKPHLMDSIEPDSTR